MEVNIRNKNNKFESHSKDYLIYPSSWTKLMDLEPLANLSPISLFELILFIAMWNLNIALVCFFIPLSYGWFFGKYHAKLKHERVVDRMAKPIDLKELPKQIVMNWAQYKQKVNLRWNWLYSYFLAILRMRTIEVLQNRIISVLKKI